MEDLRTYIESGILELYVLGEVTPEERAEVEAMALKHPSVKAELDEIGRAMELYAQENAVEPSEALRGRVLNSLVTNFGDDGNFPSHTHNSNDNFADGSPSAANNVVTFNKVKTNNFYKYAFAACLALLIVSLAALVSVYNKLQDSNGQIVALQSQSQQFSSRVNLMDRELSVFRDPTYKLLKLQGTQKSPSSGLTVAFSPAKKKVLIDMANAKMPVNDKEHQYQLWALVNGKPVDLGVFDANGDTKDMKEMKEIASADAFAVTLEPRGGSVNPTMDEMMVIGKF